MRAKEIFRAMGSPLLLPVFFVVPIVVLTIRLTGLGYPGPSAMFANGALFLLYLIYRLVLYVIRIPSPARYGPWAVYKGRQFESRLDSASARAALEGVGYAMEGMYGERREMGYWGAIAAHAGLVLLLLTGGYDNLRQLSGVLELGVGDPALLYNENQYTALVKGPLTAMEEIGMKLQVKSQMLTSPEHPQGAAGIALLDKDDKIIIEKVIEPGKPADAGSFEIRFDRIVYDAWVAVIADESHATYEGRLRLLPLRQKEGPYTYHARSRSDRFETEMMAWYDPYNQRLRVSLKDKDGGEIIDTVLGMGEESAKREKNYKANFRGIGQWSELHVIRKRHKGLLIALGCMLIAGIALRLAFMPRRVWLEERDGRMLVRTTDRRVRQLLGKG